MAGHVERPHPAEEPAPRVAGRALEQLESWSGGPFLISAAPGAGKTRPALELARRLLAARTVARVVVVCPTTPLTRQWARAAAQARRPPRS